MDVSSIMVGGSLWLNLANTTYMNNGQQEDLLQDPNTFKQWVLASELIDSSETELINMSILTEQLKRLRRLSFTILEQIQNGDAMIDLDPLNQFLSSFALKVEVKWDDGRFVSFYQADSKEKDILYQIAISLVNTLEESPLSRIRQCEHEDCILYFLDTSKAGKRRWCSMETCGNRHKALEFYRKKKGTT